jgi:NADH:ubiquinone oxidoreductase subunit 3 (subunit A)
MLSTAFLMTKKKENFDGNSFLQGGSPNGSFQNKSSVNSNSQNVGKAVASFVKIFILLLILDIAIIIFGLYCLFLSGLQWYVIIPVLIFMFMPGIGTAVAIAVIVYHFATKHTSKPGAISSKQPTLSNAKASFSISPTYQFF